MSDPFGTSPRAVQTARMKKMLILASVFVLAVVAVLLVLDVIDVWIALAIVAFEVITTPISLWAINRGERAQQEDSPLSEP